MTEPVATAWYVYCILPADAVAQQRPGILPGVPLQMIFAGGMGVLASLVDRAVFDVALSADNAADPAWIAARVQAHHDVNMAVAADGPCLPLTFGVLFSSLDRLQVWIADHVTALRSALDRVADRAEWTLTVVTDQARHDAWLAIHDDCLRDVVERIAAAPQGMAFLLGSRRRKAECVARANHLDAVATRVGDILTSAGLHHLTEPTKADLRRWVILASVPSRRGPDWHRPLSVLADDLAPSGVTLCVSGPWPAYAFTRTALHEELVYA